MKEIMEYWPFLLPIIVIQVILAVIALVDLLRQKTYRFGNQFFWIIVVLFVQLIGPILYFTIGKRDS